MRHVYEIQTAVIGAGVVGLAAARALALAGREVLVLECASRIGTGTSSRNSEVIHSGIYYPPGSMKALLCVEGRERLYSYCSERSIPHRRTGKVVIATTTSELAVLERYAKLAQANAVPDVVPRESAWIRRLEPELRCLGALEVPCTGIVDSHALMASLWGDLQAAGGEIACNSGICGGGRRDDGRFELVVIGSDEVLVCRELVNAAGLGAPDLARLLQSCAGELAPQPCYARGHYFTISGPSPFQRLIYPIGDAAGLGIHVTLDLEGRARFGPDVEWIETPDYRFDESRRGRFVTAIRRYYPGLDPDRLQPGYVGVRPKIVGCGEPAADFRIDGPRKHGIAGLVHLYGIESPGLTASLAIGESVASMLSP